MDPNSVPSSYYPETPHKGFFNTIGGFFIEFFETLVVFGAIFAVIYLLPNFIKSQAYQCIQPCMMEII